MEHGIPHCRRKSALDTQTSQSELSLADAMHQFDIGDRNRRGREALEAQHRGDSLFHAPMVLLDQIVRFWCEAWVLRIFGSKLARDEALVHGYAYAVS